MASFVLGAAAQAHHSAAAFDTQTQVDLEGVVTTYAWKNPHVYMTIEMTGEDGAPVEQEIEAGASSVLLPLGLTRDAVVPGEHVIIHANPNKRGPGHVALGRELVKDDGAVLPLYIASRSVRPQVNAEAESIAGTWFSPLQGFFGLNAAQRDWPFTEEAQAARAAYDSATDSTHAQCIPVGAPALMVYPVVTRVTVNPDTIVFDVDWMTSQRVVHMDMDEHPADVEPSLHGHSIGHWEGGTLVVDTVGFTPHREGLGFGVPSSTGKHLIERFSLSEDHKHLVYEVTAEDPEYLNGQGTYRAEWDYRPDLSPTGLSCDLETAQRFITDE